MENKTDSRLRKILKHWANRQDPPDNGRARLLWEAARTPHKKIDANILLISPQFTAYPSSYSNAWMQSLFTWINENTFQYGLQARLS
jgi:hypothetical protein